MSLQRLPVVAVVGSGIDEHVDRSEPLGHWLAGQGVHLITGGGRGVMAAVSRAFAESPGRKGLVLGILPSSSVETPEMPRAGYPNPWVEIPIRTHLARSGANGQDPQSRNHLIVLTAAVIVALPGGAGTSSEVGLAQRYRKPLVAFLRSRDEIPGLAEGVTVESDIARVQAFVRKQIASPSG